MGIKAPFHRCCRPFVDGSYRSSNPWLYMLHKAYAQAPEQYVRAYKILQKDLQELFDYVEPADKNLKTYSFRIHELLVRACIEVEANLKAILLENGYNKEEQFLEMDDYKKVNATHRLSSYEVKIPHWFGDKATRKPFQSWSRPDMYNPAWYQAYNKTKHNRHEQFHHANFENLIDAVAGLVVLLSSQFLNRDFAPNGGYMSVGDLGQGDGMEAAIGDYFRVRYPTDWQVGERYEFSTEEWTAMNQLSKPFRKLMYRCS